VFGIAKNQQLCKNPHIQNALITLLPRLAAANKERFVSRHLAETMAYIYRCLQSRERDRYNALMAIGLISVAAGREIKPYLQNILGTLRYWRFPFCADF
jgi:FKBP12-rapamycin complex-associated protein